MFNTDGPIEYSLRREQFLNAELIQDVEQLETMTIMLWVLWTWM